MLDGLSLDQIRVFLTTVDAGSFSAAARRLQRAQSGISDLIARLEAQLGVALFNRTGHTPQLTEAGAVLLSDARTVVAAIDALRARAKGMAAGIEPELSVVFDSVFPMAAITRAAAAFAEAFPRTPLRLYVEALGSSYQPLLDRRATLGIIGSVQIMPQALVSEPLGGVPFVMVAAAGHPLATWPGRIPKAELARHTQLVLTDRSELSQGREFYVFSQNTWRLADLFAKHAFLVAGLGWGGMPQHVVHDDLKAGRLVTIAPEDFPREGLIRPMAAAWPADAPPGPAGRWMIERLKQTCELAF